MRGFHGALIAATCVMALSATACRKPVNAAPEISVREQITPQPVRVGEATVALQLADAKADPVTGATIIVEADMTHPGMSPVFKTANETVPGRYEAPITFTMGGDWVLLFHIKLANGKKIERQLDVRGVSPN
jgi:hypothetical protein